MKRGFVVLDFETTGFAPARGDRVLEVGAVYMDPDLRIESALETLINPQRDVGPTRVHGVSARDVFDAPTLDRGTPSLLAMLDGRVIVGHNVSFDVRFLTAELEREGYVVPDFVTVDTLQIAKSLLRRNPPPAFKLPVIARHLGFEGADVLSHAGFEGRPEHSALGDAIVTAYLLAQFVRMTPESNFWQVLLDRAEAVSWPEYVPVDFHDKQREGSPGARSSKDEATVEASVGEVLEALGIEKPAPMATAEYAKLLEESFADRVLDRDEIDALVRTARQLGLDTVTLGSLHRGEFDRVVVQSWADGELTEAEKSEIRHAARLLGIDEDSLRNALDQEPIILASTRACSASESASVKLPDGASIVLTGEMSVQRSAIEAEIVALGFIVERTVTKRTALVIAADPHTQSGKAKKARDYGIRLLSENEGIALLRSTKSDS